MNLLSRTVLVETSKQTLFFCALYVAMLTIALLVPMINDGAPIDAILAQLPAQLPFPITLALPLALVTGVLSVISRMREDGEITALMAAGVSTVSLVRATAPLALVCALVALWLAQVEMPKGYRAMVQGRAVLMQQAIATKVSRMDPAWQDEKMTVSANGQDGDRLLNVFGSHRTKDGRMVIVFAPSAIWAMGEEGQDDEGNLELVFEHPRVLSITQSATTAAKSELDLKNSGISLNLSGAPFPIIHAEMPQFRIVLPKQTGAAKEPAQGKSLHQLQRDIRDMRSRLASMKAAKDPALTKEISRLRSKISGHCVAWHIQWVLPVSVLCYWLLSLGMALTVGAGSRLIAAFFGIGIVLGSALPPLAIVNLASAVLPFSPGWILWPLPVLTASAGILLIWRRR